VVVLDGEGKRLYVSQGNQLLVVDTAASKVVGEVPVKGTPRSVALATGANRGFITLGREDDVVVFDLTTHEVLGRVPLDGDPSACVYDAPSRTVLVCCPELLCVVPIPADIDLETGKPDSPIMFQGRPTGIASDGHGTVYVTANHLITLIETETMMILTKWALHNVWPVGIALDQENGRVFVWTPPYRLIALSFVDGRELGSVDMRRPMTSIAVLGGKVFAPTTDGHLRVVGQAKGGRYEVQQKLPIGGGVTRLAVGPKAGSEGAGEGVIYLPGYDDEGWKKRVKDSFKIQVVEKK